MATRSEVSRRNFLKTSVKTSAQFAAIAGAGFVAGPGKILGANDCVRVAVCGIHGWGFDYIKRYPRLSNAEVTAVCDVDENVVKQRLGEMRKIGLKPPPTYVDVYKLLEDKSLDALSVATPNHWHSLMAIWGWQAAKNLRDRTVFWAERTGSPSSCPRRRRLSSRTHLRAKSIKVAPEETFGEQHNREAQNETWERE
jgi:Oxidoreductase family, NAD-binding Rossmann fold